MTLVIGFRSFHIRGTDAQQEDPMPALEKGQASLLRQQAPPSLQEGGQALSMILHAGGKLVTRDQVAAVEVPEGTKTWHPRSHISILSKIEELLDLAGYDIASQQLALSHNGNRTYVPDFDRQDFEDVDGTSDYS